MPIFCPIQLPRLTRDEFRELDYLVTAHAFATHQALGRLADEALYQADIAERLASAGLSPIRREIPVTVSFRSFTKSYLLDLVVADRAIYEIKTASALLPEHEAQLLHYLLLTGSTRGKLLNFRTQSVESRFVNTSLDHVERRRFRTDTRAWAGDSEFSDLLLELLQDWGTSLECAHYTQAMVHLLGGEAVVTQQLPMTRDAVPLGNQRFHLASPDTALRITTFAEPMPSYEPHLRRLLDLSPLRRFYWVNISHHTVHFISLERTSS